ncbi:spore germination protein [Paenibacillus sp. p3-SID1389]|uniref:spore germination protein n=1 Tax=Paenibacillus sp. p3-SID1389 TaxID=2916364 RepID=UPI0021A7BC08|nr:spore germination protein [Paenibacillus sp. p3-SID1389]MCT2197273.1 spore germination protein [Paenibacillus sp. p3-SID1389]
MIVGPHDAFNESIGTNLSIIRRRLKVEQFEVGEVFKSKVSMLYIDRRSVSPPRILAVFGYLYARP